MCFSATASFVAAASLGMAGAVTLGESKNKAWTPLAAMPLLFAAQQFVEGVVWATPHHPVLNSIAATSYVMYSHVLWPTYVPFAVMAAEPAGRRRSIIGGFLVLGVSISIWLLWHIAQGPVYVTTAQNCLVYNTSVPPIPYGLAAYVFAACFSCFFSSHKYVRVFGLALLTSLGLSLWSYRQAFYSVWCFFAAILSLIIYAHLRQGRLVPTMQELKSRV